MTVTLELPSSADEAADLMADGGVLLAGGTHVMPWLNTRAHNVGRLVSLRHAGLAGIEVTEGIAQLGAATTLAQIGREERLAVLAPVIESIGSPTIRNLATIGGNLFVPAPYGDLTVALLALDAEVETAGAGRQQLPVAAVVRGELPPGSVVTSVRFAVPAQDEFFYTKAMRRRLNSASIVTVAAVLAPSDGIVRTARVALAGAGPRPRRSPGAEAALTGVPLSRKRAQAAGAAAAATAAPLTDAYASAWYRRRVLPIHIRRALIGS